jgi:hypothetical protein
MSVIAAPTVGPADSTCPQLDSVGQAYSAVMMCSGAEFPLELGDGLGDGDGLGEVAVGDGLGDGQPPPKP